MALAVLSKMGAPCAACHRSAATCAGRSAPPRYCTIDRHTFVEATLLFRFSAAVAGCLVLGIAGLSPTQTTPKPADDAILLTVFLRHDQSKKLDEINDELAKNGYYEKFPPQGIEIVSWYVMMGVGQVVTLRVPPERLREVNRVIEETAWGPYRAEFYPTYD